MEKVKNSITESDMTIRISSELEKKISFLCKNIRKVEWSGILFYNLIYPSDDNTIKSLEIHCVDVLLMNIGTSCSTIFSTTPDVINYLTMNNMVGCRCGLIHSHNMMEAYFSSVDIDTIKKEVMETGEFVSLVVNNYGDYVAALGELSTVSIEGKVTKNFTEKVDEVSIFGLNVCKEEDPVISKEFKERIEELTNMAKVVDMAREHNSKTTLLSEPGDRFWETTIPDIEPQSSTLPSPPVNEPRIERLIWNLLSGNMLYNYISTTDKEEVLTNMESNFDNRFGKNPEGYEDFKTWASYTIECCLSERWIIDYFEVVKEAYKILDSINIHNRYIDYFKEEFTDMMKDVLGYEQQ